MVSTAKISLNLVKVYVVMVALSLPMRSVMVTRLLASLEVPGSNPSGREFFIVIIVLKLIYLKICE